MGIQMSLCKKCLLFYNNVERLKEEFGNRKKNRKNVRILANHGGSWVKFKRIVITLQQIERYKLTHLMHHDKETLAKLWKKETWHTGSIFYVELDAMGLIPNYEKLITMK
jgi:hypothetical protein